MPYKVVKRSGIKPYKIVNKGKTVGSSTSKAEASIRARNAGKHGWK